MKKRNNSTETTFQRNVSPVEKIFLTFAKIDSPFCNQLVLEGTGVLDASRWEKAVDAACAANPGSRLVYKGRSAWAKWVDSGVTAPIRRIDGSGWSGDGSDGAPFLFDPLPFKTSHSCEVLLVNGNPPRVVFRSLHASMDGGGTLEWAYDIFRALRGEPLMGSFSTITDAELLARLNYPVKREQLPKTCLTPTGSIDGEARGFIWKRARLQGKFPKLVPQLALAVAQEARKQGPGSVCIFVPLDLRRRVSDIRSTANLTRRIALPIPPDATIDTIQHRMRDSLDNLSGDPKLAKLFCYIPLGWMEQLFTYARKKDQRKGRYRDTGSISNFGKLPIELFRGGGFEAQTGFFIPPGLETKPFFMGLVGWGDSIEMLVSMPKVLASNGRLDRFMTNVVSGLQS